MQTPKILVSTGTFIGKPNGRNHRLLLDIVPNVQADGFEFMIYDDWYAKLDQIVQDLESLHMKVPVLHVEKSIGHLISLGDRESMETAIEKFRKNIWVAGMLGSEKLVIHLWNGPSLDRNIRRNLAAYPALFGMAKAAGLLLTVENVVTYGESPDHPLDYMRELTSIEPEAAFTYDLKMAAFHAQNEKVWQAPWSFLWEEGRVAHLHVSDYAGGFMDFKNLRTRHIGEGNIDFEAFFRKYNRTARCDTVTLECLSFLEDGSVTVEAMNRDVEKMRALLSLGL